MIWGKKRIEYKIGDIRERERFAWMPCELTDGRMIWLQRVRERHELRRNPLWPADYLSANCYWLLRLRVEAEGKP